MGLVVVPALFHGDGSVVTVAAVYVASDGGRFNRLRACGVQSIGRKLRERVGVVGERRGESSRPANLTSALRG